MYFVGSEVAFMFDKEINRHTGNKDVRLLSTSFVVPKPNFECTTF
jgi:hypothetical protein